MGIKGSHQLGIRYRFNLGEILTFIVANSMQIPFSMCSAGCCCMMHDQTKPEQHEKQSGKGTSNVFIMY